MTSTLLDRVWAALSVTFTVEVDLRAAGRNESLFDEVWSAFSTEPAAGGCDGVVAFFFALFPALLLNEIVCFLIALYSLRSRGC